MTSPPEKPDQGAYAILPSLVFLALVLLLLVLGQVGIFGDLRDLSDGLTGLGDHPLGLVLIVGIFCIAAYLGVPQFGLIAATILAVGPWTGMLYAWLATLVSGSLTFWSGRFAGEQAVRDYAGAWVNRLSAMLGQNAFLASALVRNVPTGPFLMVNMLFGASRAGFFPFLAGLAIGVLPKIAIIAFAGQGVIAVLNGAVPLAIGGAILFFGLCGLGIWVLRRGRT